jgi:hypothetical protein
MNAIGEDTLSSEPGDSKILATYQQKERFPNNSGIEKYLFGVVTSAESWQQIVVMLMDRINFRS